jgi:hypothetical protein
MTNNNAAHNNCFPKFGFSCKLNGTSSLGDPPASIFSMLTGGFVFSIVSLLFFGWITVAYSIIMGLVLKRIENRRNGVNNQS